MVEDRVRPNELKNPGYEVFIGALSALAIINLVLVYAIADKGLSAILITINFLLSGIFLLDFLYRLKTADSKVRYFVRQYGWADLLSAVPIKQVKVFRIFRLVRVYRLSRDYGTNKLIRSFLHERAESALYTLLLLGILVLEFGSLAMLRIEQHAIGANIKSASDALWYVVVTISTVGYGDQYPVTNPGRVLGAMIIVVGVGIFGTFTGYLANLFLAPRRARAAQSVDPARLSLDQLRNLLTQQQGALEELERALPASE
jgi:voltage-gated potassium channel